MRRRDFLSAASATMGLMVLTQTGCGGGGSSAPVVVPQAPGASSAEPVVASGADALTFDASGKRYAIDADANRLVAYHDHGATRWAVGGFGSEAGKFNAPSDLVCAPNGQLYVIDAGNARVQVFDTSGNFLFQFGSYGDGNGQFVTPNCIDVASEGALYISDAAAHRVQIFRPDGSFVASIGGFGVDGASLNGPMGLAVQGSQVYVADTGNSRVQVYDLGGRYLRSIGGTTESLGLLLYPYDIEVSDAGDVYVSDPARGIVAQYDSLGVFVRRFEFTSGGAPASPQALAFDLRQLLHVAV